MTSIVTVNLSITSAPAPSTLQRTAAFISQGATTLAAGTYSLLTLASSLTPLLTAPGAITSMSLSGGVVTVTTTAPHGYTNADVLPVTIAGVTPSAYNGTFNATVTGTSTFTYPLTGSPGSVTVQGTYIVANQADLVAMNSTFNAQGNPLSVYVLELGPGSATDGPTALVNFINASPQIFYSYLCPRRWGNTGAFATTASLYEAPTAMTYFHLTVTGSSYSSYATIKSCICTIEAPSNPNSEFTAAAMFYATLNWNPSSINQVPPLAYTFAYDVTPYPTLNNSSTLATYQAAFVNVIGTAAEGGLSNSIMLYGTTMDGNQFNYWYAVDWMLINLNLTLSNEIINGSNNPQAPLYYNQAGINRLQARAQQTLNNGAVYGLILSSPNNPVTVTAVPFYTYVSQNPSAYKTGTYNGLAATATPQTGFLSIVFNLNITNFIAG